MSDIYLRPGLAAASDIELYPSAPADAASYTLEIEFVPRRPRRPPSLINVHVAVSASAWVRVQARADHAGRRRREDELVLVGAF